MWKIDMPPLIAKIRHDTFVKMKYCGDCICRKLSQLDHIKIWKKINQSCFCPCMLCITRARTHGNYLKRTLIPLLMGRKRWTRYQNAWENVPNMMTEKIWRFYVEKYPVRRENARACACARFLAKCLKWPKTYAKWIWDDFEHFYFLRAR